MLVCKMLNVELVFKRLNTDRLHFRAQQRLCKSNKTFSVRADETYRGPHPMGVKERLMKRPVS